VTRRSYEWVVVSPGREVSQRPFSWAFSGPAPLAAASLHSRRWRQSARTHEYRCLLTQNRLITVSGPPGVGKTRLAVEVGHAVQPTIEEGVRMAELAPVTEGVT
jgi:hypothetical protein